MVDNILSDLKDKCFAGQKRTGKSKQFVFLCGDEVWKGPYKQDKINTILSRSEVLKRWRTPLIVHPLRVEQEWIVFPNIGKDYPIEKYFWNQESYSEHGYWVAERNIVDKMNNVILENKWLYDMPEIIEACVHLWILGVGDTGFFNILADQQKKLVYVIDYEENAGNIREGECFYFSKDPAMKFKWYGNVAKHYSEIAKKLENLDPNFSEEIDHAIRLLLHYSKNDIVDKMDQLQMSEAKETDGTGKMQWKGMFGGTTTFSGYKMDVIKSGLQKYIRRGIVDKALYCGFELFRLGEVGGEAGMTNLFNRLRIIAAEDIGVAGFNSAIAVINMINQGIRDPGSLKSAIEMLGFSQKTRIGSHLCNVYKRPECIAYAKTKGIIIDTGYEIEDEKFISEHTSDDVFRDIVNEDLKACAIMFYKRLFEKDFNAVAWWGFFDYYANLDNVKVKMRNAYYDGNKWRKSTKPISILFDVLDMFVDKFAMNVLKQAYFDIPESKPTAKKPHPSSENRAIFVLGIVAALYGIKYEKVDIVPNNEGLDDLLNGRYKLEIDDYVIDKHTAEGAQKGKTRVDFVKEGAIVIPEDMSYHYDDLVEIYMNC